MRSIASPFQEVNFPSSTAPSPGSSEIQTPCAAVAESADALPIGASCTFRVNKSRTWLRDDDQDIPKFGRQVLYQLNCANAGGTPAVSKVHLRCSPANQAWELGGSALRDSR